jgi:Tfp pilus assembly protein PilF
MTVIQLALANDSLNSVIEVSKEGMKLFPTNFYFPIMAAAGYNQQKRYDKAVEVLKSVDYSNVQNGKAVSNLLCTLADNYYLMDSLDLAFDTYEQAIGYDADNYMAYNNAGYFLAESGRDIEKAMRYTRYAVLSEPQNATYLDSYAWALFKNKDYEKAKENIDLAIKYSSDEVVEGDTLIVNEDTDYDDELIDNDSSTSLSADILAHAGDIYFMSGDPDGALDFWKKAAALKPDDELLARKVKHKTYFYK